MNALKRLFFVFIMVFYISSSYATKYYVAVNGKENNNGEKNSPLTLIAAIAKVSAGDTILIESGTYSLSATINISKSGTENRRIFLFAASSERPILDFSPMSTNDANYGIKLSGSYWHIKGIRIRQAGDNGLLIQGGSNNIIEFCDFFENHDSGCQLKGGASNNVIINCDSYNNRDPDEGDADGFAPKMDVGSGNVFIGCRAWNNSDDGWDGYLRGTNNVTTRLENCWCFRNGYLKDGSASSGNGNGFKMGGSDDKTLKHNFILIRCLAFENRVKGFDQNNNRGLIILYNCTAFSNRTNYSVNGENCSLMVINCIAGGNGSNSLKDGEQKTNNLNVSNSNFISINSEEALLPRKPDGSLPDINFLHLTSSSQLIDAGTIITGVSFNGKKPDLGCFEYESPTSILTLQRSDNDFTYSNFYKKNLLIINSNQHLSPLSIKFFMLNGVYKKEHIVSNQSFITLKKFPSACYCISITNNNTTGNTKKIIKNKNSLLLH